MRQLVLSTTLLVAIVGCGSRQSTTQQQPQQQPLPPPQAQQHQPQQQQRPAPTAQDGSCPMKALAAANIAESDTADGAAITFTTTGNVDALRADVHKLAEVHGASGSSDSSGAAGPHQPGMSGKIGLVPSHATVEDITGGARLVFVPVDPAQAPALREHAREHVAMMQRGECPVMKQPDPSAAHAGGG